MRYMRIAHPKGTFPKWNGALLLQATQLCNRSPAI